MALKVFRADNTKIVKGCNSKANKTILNLFNKSKNKKSRNWTCIPNIKVIAELIFPTYNAKKSFNYFRQIFIKTLIF